MARVELSQGLNNAGLGYDTQDVLIQAEEQNLSLEEYKTYLDHLRKVVREGLDQIFNNYHVDIIIGSSDSSIKSLASGSGKFALAPHWSSPELC